MNRHIGLIFFIFILNILPIFSQMNWYRWNEPINNEILNSSNDDFAPQFNKFDSTLYFNSNRNGKSLFYTSELNLNYEFSRPLVIDNGINSTAKNQSYITFLSKDIAYFTSFNKTSLGAVLNIFESRMQKNTWQKGTILDCLKTDDFRFHPTISPNGNFMIFAQASPENPDDSDLWMAFRDGEDSWTGMIRLDILNTNKSEITPFLASNDTLYFASNGFSGKGGYDIYYSINIDGIWQKPRPLNEINTEYDESDFVILPNNTAIFASNRPNGKGKLDLWLTHRVPIIFEPTHHPSIILSTYVTQIRINEEKFYIQAPINPLSNNFLELFNKLNNIRDKNVNDFANLYFSKYAANPEILEINLHIENADSISSWQIELISDTNRIYSQKGKEAEYKLQIDLNNIAKNIISDSLILKAKLFNNNEQTIFENQSALIVFQSHKEKPFNLGNSIYSQSYLFAYPNDFTSDWIGQYQPYFEQIRKQNPYNKQIEVLYSQNLSKSEQNEIINQLKTIFQDKRIIKHNDAKIKELPLFLNQISCKYYIIIM